MEALKSAEKMRKATAHISEPTQGESVVSDAINRQQTQQNQLQRDDEDHEQMPEIPESHTKFN